MLMEFAQAVVAGDTATASRLLAASQDLPKATLAEGAARHGAANYFFPEIAHYMYEGDTALHVAAAAYRHEVARKLIAAGANVRARNRRGAEPLHYAVGGAPGSHRRNPSAQAASVAAKGWGREIPPSRWAVTLISGNHEKENRDSTEKARTARDRQGRTCSCADATANAGRFGRVDCEAKTAVPLTAGSRSKACKHWTKCQYKDGQAATIEC
jgi:ankyrin repeat protein